MATSNRYPLIPLAIQGIVLSTELFGILANAFFVTILLRYHRGWDAGKILMFAYHATALVFLALLFFPLITVVSTGQALTSVQCSGIVPPLQVVSLFLPLSLLVAAHYRLKIVQAAKGSSSAEPNVKRYMCYLLAFVLAIVVISHATANGTPFVWTGFGMLCVRRMPVWIWTFNLIFFVTAPYFIYCYRKVVTTIRDFAQDGGTEFVRLIYALVLFFYIAYLPHYIVIFLQRIITPPVPVPAVAFQLVKWMHIAHSAFSPIVSITLTKRYRRAAIDILRCQMPQGSTATSSSGRKGRNTQSITVASSKEQALADERIGGLNASTSSVVPSQT